MIVNKSFISKLKNKTKKTQQTNAWPLISWIPYKFHPLWSNNEQTQLASFANYRDGQRRRTHVFAQLCMCTKYSLSYYCRILSDRLRKCFGLVDQSTDKGRQALLSITDGLWSCGQSQKDRHTPCHVLWDHILYINMLTWIEMNENLHLGIFHFENISFFQMLIVKFET